MRDAFIDTLMKLARRNSKIFLITADYGFSLLEKFRDEFPGRFLNVGIAEQNMIGIAAGLSLSGKCVFTYSQIPFTTLRCLEHIRNDLCYQKLGVKLVGIGSGFAYDTLGFTHHAIEDIGVMRALPNMIVLSPGDPIEVRRAVESSLKIKLPVYIRLAKRGEPVINKENMKFEIGKGNVVKDGGDVALFTTGNSLKTAVDVARILENKGLSTMVISMHTLKPIDKNLIKKVSEKVNCMFSIEEHNTIGGLGSAISEVLTELDHHILFKRFGVDDEYLTPLGKIEYIREKINLTPRQLSKSIINISSRKYLKIPYLNNRRQNAFRV